MPATPIGDTRTVSVVLINKTDQPQSYEFAVPADSDLTLSPHVGRVPPQSRLRVQIDYSPRPPVDGEQQGALPPPSAPNTARGPRDGGGGGAMANGNGSGGYEHYNDDGEPEDGEGDADGHTDTDSFQSPSARASPVQPLGRGGRGGRGGAAGEDEDEDEDAGELPVRGKSSSSSKASSGRRSSSPQLGGRQGLAMGRINEVPDDDDADAEAEAAAEAEQRTALAALKRIQSMGGGDPGWYRWREHAITCYIKPQSQNPTPSQSQSGQAPAASAPSDGASGAAAAAETAASSGPAAAPPPQEIHLQVATCAVLPDLVLLAPPDLPYVPLHQCHCLDFGPVPVGQRVVRRLELANEGEEPLVLGAESMDSREVGERGGWGSVVRARVAYERLGGEQPCSCGMLCPDVAAQQRLHACLASFVW